MKLWHNQQGHLISPHLFPRDRVTNRIYDLRTFEKQNNLQQAVRKLLLDYQSCATYQCRENFWKRLENCVLRRKANELSI